MGETMTTKKKKKKGRPSLLDLQKRSLKQQKLLHKSQKRHQNQPPPPPPPPPPPRNPNSIYPDSLRRSARPNPNSAARDDAAHRHDSSSDDDERKQKKHKLLLGFNSSQQQPNRHRPNSDSNADGGDSPEAAAATKRRKIGAVRLGSDQTVEKVSKATDTLRGSPVEPGPTTPLPDKKLLVFILDRLQKKDTYGVFSEPVDPEELPDYFDVIEHPMDFATVRKKLDGGVYANLEQFEKDVFLICSNAMEYNPPDTIYFRQARSMQELAKKDFENLRQDSDDSEPEPEPKVVRRGRPPGKMKKPLERSHSDRVGPEFSSDATLATGGDNSSWSNGYNLRRSTASKYQPADASVRASPWSHSSETHATWLSEWENEFPASVLRAVLKYGKKSFAVDENRRDSYKDPSPSRQEPSVLTTFEGECKQLMMVGLNSEHGYARSLARFAAGLGPLVWRIASKKIESVLPAGVDFGPGWIGENKMVEGQQLLFSNKQHGSNYVSDDNLSRFQTLIATGNNPIHTTRCSWTREDMAEPIGGLSSQSESTSLNSSVGGIKRVASVPVPQKPVIHSDLNGSSGGLEYDCSPQMGTTRLGASTRISNLEHAERRPPMFGLASTSSTTFSPVLGNDCSLRKTNLLETSNGLLHSGSVSIDPRALLNAGLGGKQSWPGLPLHNQQESFPFPPDLNVGYLAPTSPSSNVPIGSPQQPDLALQL